MKGERATQHNALLTGPPAAADDLVATVGGMVSSALCCVARSPFTMLTSALDRLNSRCRKSNV